MIEKIKDWYSTIATKQKIWIIGATLAILILGIISGDLPINIIIGVVGMIYVGIYGLGTTRWSFILGIVYVSLYTIICLKNRIMLDALQNIILIPIYFASFIHWGKRNVKPRNATSSQIATFIGITTLFAILLFGLSRLLNGNYSGYDAINTSCTLMAMILAYYGFSENWVFWSINNVVSALTFGLALATPTGSIAVFAMKVIFMINGFVGWYNFHKIGKDGD